MPTAINFATVAGPIGVAASPSLIVVSQYLTQNILAINCSGVSSVIATIPGTPSGGNEKYIAFAPNQSSSAGFTPGDIFITQGKDIYRLSGSVLSHFTNIPAATDSQTGICFDKVGTFGNLMIVTSINGKVWKVDSAGTATLIVDTATTVEGPAVVPSGFGPQGGQLWVADETNGQVHAIDGSGTITLDIFDWPGVAAVCVQPFPVPLACSYSFYVSAYNLDTIYGYAPGDFTTQSVLLVSKLGSGIADVTWNGTSYSLNFFDNISGAQLQAGIVDGDVPTPPSRTADITLAKGYITKPFHFEAFFAAPVLQLQTVGVVIDNSCYPANSCNPSTPPWKLDDMGFNAIGTLNFTDPLDTYCGPPYLSTDRIWEFNVGLLRSNVYGFTDCTDPPTNQYNYAARAAVGFISGIWYVWIYDYFDGPGNVFSEFFYGEGTTLPIVNSLTAFSGCNTPHPRTGPLMDTYWGSCTPGSGSDSLINIGKGGTVNLTFV